MELVQEMKTAIKTLQKAVRLLEKQNPKPKTDLQKMNAYRKLIRSGKKNPTF